MLKVALGSLRYLAIRYPLHKICPRMQIVRQHSTGSLSFVSRDGDTLKLEDVFESKFVWISYRREYNYSLVTVEDAAELEDDPVTKLAYMVLAGDPQACDAARDVLRC